MSQNACDTFTREVVNTVGLMRREYEMSYAEIVGCLEIISHQLKDVALEDEDRNEIEE